MQEISKLFQQKQIFKDPYWKAVFESDLRNIFPKHELAKIERTKCKISKIRLIMEHIEQFMAMEICKKEMQINSETNNEQNLQTELIELQRQMKQHKHYDLSIINKKQQISKLANQMIKGNLDPIWIQKINNHPKWGAYWKKNKQNPKEYQPQSLNTEKIELAKAICLDEYYQFLTEGTQGQIISKRIKQRQISKCLAKLWNGTMSTVPDCCKGEWEHISKQFNPQQYV